MESNEHASAEKDPPWDWGMKNPATPQDILRTLQTLFGAGAITFKEYKARKKELLERT
jgi:hypothetical protein